jgi:hypothetical protein
VRARSRRRGRRDLVSRLVVAIYRPPKARWPVAVAFGIGGVLIGLVIGLALGRSDPDPEEAGTEIKAALVSAASTLEVTAIEYEESVSDGEVTKEAEYEGALSALESSRARYDEVRPVLVSLFPSQVEPIDDLYGEIERLMRSRTDPAQVNAALQELESILKGEVPDE